MICPSNENKKYSIKNLLEFLKQKGIKKMSNAIDGIVLGKWNKETESYDISDHPFSKVVCDKSTKTITVKFDKSKAQQKADDADSEIFS